MKVRMISPEYTSYAGIKEVETFSQRKLTLIYLAGLLPGHCDVEIIDGDIQDIKYDCDVDLVALSFTSNTANRAFEIAKKYRDLNVPVVFGGFHTSLFPGQVMKYADSIVIGESENIWNELLTDLENNQLKKVYQCQEMSDLKNLPLPRYDLYQKSAYCKQFPLFITRGCPYQCSFCCIKQVYGKSFRKRPINEVVKNIEHIIENYHDNSPVPLSFSFVDDNIWGDKKYARELFQALKALHINWYAQGASIEIDDDLLLQASESGCSLLFVGFESLIPDNLIYLNKNQNDIEKYADFIQKLHQVKISVGSYFILGLPYDNENVFKDLFQFLQTNLVEFPMIMIYQLVPGTKAYQESGYKITDFQKMIDHLPVYLPLQMGRSQFRENYVELHRNLFTDSSIDHRLQSCKNIAMKFINKGHQQFYAHPQWDEWTRELRGIMNYDILN